MDRSWMNASRASVEYDNGIGQFLKFARENCSEPDERYFCPCVKCMNGRRHEADTIREHLVCEGINTNYTVWIWHGEIVDVPTGSTHVDADGDQFEEMIRDVGQESFQKAHVYDALKSDSETPLYPGCENFTRLSAVLKLVNLKAINGWSDKSFTELLQLMNDMLPKGNTLPKRTYEAKKVLCPMGMGYKKIHACPNDCIMYRKEFEELHKCPRCGLSRYKVKNDGGDTQQGPPAKVLWYLPIVPRFKQLFANRDDAKNLTWHATERKSNGLIRHPADATQWKKLDHLFPDFGSDARNLRLGLSTDGMNPFGPKQPGNDIDVYLSPLIDDLRMMWDEGIDVFDGYRQQSFKLRAILFCTINDFPAYGNLSGYSVKGHHACPICEENTSYIQLKHGNKTVYTQHRRFLSRHHPYRRLPKAFNGFSENGLAPMPLTGEQVYDRVKNINTLFGKTKKKAATTSIWKKRSIFFDLPYWRHLDVRHCIDGMHVEKNVCDSLIGTLLNVKHKTNDGVQARQDLKKMGIRPQLHPQVVGKRTYLPPACYTLSKREKIRFCNCLQGIKVPQGYSSNIKSLVSMQNFTLAGLKSYDCHVLMQQLLLVAIRDVLPKNVRNAITRLCFFFNSICSKVIPSVLDEWKNEAVVILCQLEMYFPPSFFDIMVHLLVHVVREIEECGPVYLRWMYPIERYMKIFKRYTKNPFRPEASIVERYIAEEAIEFCTDYMSQTPSVGLPKSRHDVRLNGKGTHGVKILTKNRDEVLQAHLYVLNNTDEVLPYLSAHKNLLKRKNPRMSEKWLLIEHNKTFLRWFKVQISESDSASEMLKWLAYGPKSDVVTWKGYDINKYSFYTKSQDDKSTVQNSGVTLQAESMHFSSSKDKNPVMASTSYYGVIEDIWEIDYVNFRVPVFKCKWVDNSTGVVVDELGVTLVDLHKIAYTDEPFIMAYQAKQVFYVKDPNNEILSVVIPGRSVDINETE